MIRTLSLWTVALAIAAAALCRAQTLRVYDVDASRFSEVRARFLAFDADGSPIADLTPADVTVAEDGVECAVTAINYCTRIQQRPLTVGIMVDTYSHIDLARAGARRLIDFLRMPPSEIGITVMDHGVFIAQDLTTKKEKTLAAAAALPPAAGVDVQAMFYDAHAGGVGFVSGRPNRKVLILISDLHCPNLNLDENRLYADAAREGIAVYAVLLHANDYTGLFKRIAGRTGGKVFERVTRTEDIENIFTAIGQEQLAEPCEIVWQGNPRCMGTITARFDLPVHGISTTARYSVPGDRRPMVTVSPRLVKFGDVPVGQPSEQEVTITALNVDAAIDALLPDDPSLSIVDYGGPPPPFVLAAGTPRTLRLRCVASKTGGKLFGIDVVSKWCFPRIFGFIGRRDGRPLDSALRIVRPNGGEAFPVRSDTAFEWEGVSPLDTVQLEYSTDAGATWITVTRGAVGLRHPWNVPNTPSNRCLARVTQMQSGGSDDGTRRLVTTYVRPQGNRVQQWAPDGRFVFTVSDSDAVSMWDAGSGREVWRVPLPGTTEYPVLAVSPDGTMLAVSARSRGTNAPTDSMFVLDAMTGDVRWGIPGGHQGISWSRDSRYVATTGDRTVAGIWDMTTGARTASFVGFGTDIRRAQWSPVASEVAVGLGLNGVAVCDPAGTVLAGLESRAGRAVETIGWSPAGDQVVIGFDPGDLSVWDRPSASLLFRYSQPFDISETSFDPSGRFFVASWFNGPMIVRDAAAFFELFNVSSPPGTSIVTFDWSPDGSSIAQTAESGTILVRLLPQGDTVRVVKIGGSSLSAMDWNPKGDELMVKRLYDSTLIVPILPPVFQRDVSDSLWAIVVDRPQIAVTNVDMGTVLLGGMKDSVVRAVVCNVGDVPLHIAGIDVVSGNVADFMIPVGAGDFTLAPNECRDVTFEFMPTALGARAARAYARVVGDTISTPITITGVGVAPTVDVVAPVVDFGTVALPDHKDTTVAVMLRNIGAAPIAITGTTQLGPDMKQFEILSGGGAFTLAPGETRSMDLRFKPVSIGRTSGRIAFQYAGVGSPAVASLFGRGVGGVVYVPDDSAAAGEKFGLRLKLESALPRAQGGTPAKQRWRATLAMDQTLLAPNGSASSTKDGVRTMAVEGEWDGAGDVLGTIPMVALLGASESTSVDVTAFDWLDDAGQAVDLETERRSGRFVLTGICREGGDRLYDAHGVATKVSIAPNPSRDRSELSYDLAEDGPVELVVYDMRGVQVRVLASGERRAGRYRLSLNTSELPAGSYEVVLRTATQRASVRLTTNR